VTLTVCPALQFSGVNVSVDGATVPSLTSALTIETVTWAIGSELNATVNVCAEPPSLVVNATGDTTRLASSSSAFVTPTVAVVPSAALLPDAL
jgi:hypothetical protein